MEISISKKSVNKISRSIKNRGLVLLTIFLVLISIAAFFIYYKNGLGLAYNDARSHLDIGRRVVEGLKPGLAQLGSVWLPLPHALMIPTIWIDFFWHTGLSGSIISMLSFVGTNIVIYYFLKNLGVGILGRLAGIVLFVANINILYLQSTAMTELLLMVTMTTAAYYLLLWHKNENLLHLIKTAGFIMLSTLVRYDGWFLLFFATLIVAWTTFRKKGFRATEGTIILFCTLGGLGVVLWLIWNLLIFKDPLYFAFGPFSAHAQQEQLLEAGDLLTKGDLLLSLKVYIYALLYNSYTVPALLALVGAIMLWFDKKIKKPVRIASLALLAPLIFNIIALYLGHSVLFLQGISGNTWFNVRYGVLVVPAIAVYVGYLVDRAKTLRTSLIGVLAFVLLFAFFNNDAVTIDDATVGSSQKNVTEVSGWLKNNAEEKDGFVLISAASHDAIIFSSGLPMKKFIHEGTGLYWENAVAVPDRWARWIIMRTHDENDLTYKLVSKSSGFDKYTIVESYPFADIYELRNEYLDTLETKPVLTKNET